MSRGWRTAPGDVAWLVERPASRHRQASIGSCRGLRSSGLDWRRHWQRGAEGQRIAEDVAADHLSHSSVSGFHAVERRGELPHLIVVGLKPGDLALESGDPNSGTNQRPVEGGHDDRTDGGRGGESGHRPKGPDGHAKSLRPRRPVPLDDDGHRAGAESHPSKGLPRISSSSRARSSLE